MLGPRYILAIKSSTLWENAIRDDVMRASNNAAKPILLDCVTEGLLETLLCQGDLGYFDGEIYIHIYDLCAYI